MLVSHRTHGNTLVFGLLAALASALIDAFYAVMMHGQGPHYLSSSRIQFEIIFLAAVALAAGIGAIAPWQFVRIALLSAAAVGLLCNGFLTIFSIGYLELGASALALLALFRVTGRRADRRIRLALTVGGALVAAALVLGLSLTSLP